MKKRIICFVLSFAAIFSLFGFKATQTWFASGTDKHQYMKAGNLNFVVSGTLGVATGTQILPGTDVAPDGLTISNASNIDSELRIKICCSYFDAEGTEHISYYTGDESADIINVTFAESGNAKWVSGNDDYIYYYSTYDPENTSNNVTRIVPTANASGTIETTNIPFISHLVFSGPNTDISYSGKEVTVKVIFESKQADYFSWTQLGEIIATP